MATKAPEKITTVQDVNHIRATSDKRPHYHGSLIREEALDDYEGGVVRFIAVKWRGRGTTVYRVEGESGIREIAGGHVWTVTAIFEGL